MAWLCCVVNHATPPTAYPNTNHNANTNGYASRGPPLECRLEGSRQGSDASSVDALFEAGGFAGLNTVPTSPTPSNMDYVQSARVNNFEAYRLYEPGRALSVISEEGSLTDRTERSLSSAAAFTNNSYQRRTTLEAPCSPRDLPTSHGGNYEVVIRDAGGTESAPSSARHGKESNNGNNTSTSSLGEARATARSWGSVSGTSENTTSPSVTAVTVWKRGDDNSHPIVNSGGNSSADGSAASSVSSNGGSAESTAIVSVSNHSSPSSNNNIGRRPLIRQNTGYVGQKSVQGGVVNISVTTNNAQELQQQRRSSGSTTIHSIPSNPTSAAPTLSIWDHMRRVISRSNSNGNNNGATSNDATSMTNTTWSRGGASGSNHALNVNSPSGGSSGNVLGSSRVPATLLSSRQPTHHSSSSNDRDAHTRGGGLLLRNPAHGLARSAAQAPALTHGAER